MAPMKKGIHAGHRERLKNRFVTHGLDSFETHNVLELLLFFAIPQRDTNELAHQLITHFGSLSRVLDASYQELLKVPGIGPHAATLIKLIPALSRTYMTDRQSAEPTRLDFKELGEYMVRKFVGFTNEGVYAIFYDNGMHRIGEKLLFSGSVNSAHFTMRCLIDEIVAHKATTLVLAHNHPGGLALPSPDDLNSTHRMEGYLSTCGVTLWEHYVIANNTYYGIVHERMTPNTQKRIHEIPIEQM